MNFKVFSHTDIGNYRDNQEDDLLIYDRLCLVSDGMGGHAAGELASASVVSAFRVLLDNIDHKDIGAEWMSAAVINANNDCVSAGDDRGATCTAVHLLSERSAICVNVGDSRLYHISKDKCEQVTLDQGVGYRLYSFVGLGAHMKIDEYMISLKSGDIMVLCTDGVSDYIGKEDIIETLKVCRPDNFWEEWHSDPAVELCNLALENDSRDNCTAIVIVME